VRQIARFLDVPEKIVNKAPSPDLIPGITDEFALGITYEKLDLVLVGLEREMKVDEIAHLSGLKPARVEYVKELVKRSEHMRNSPFVPYDL
jgi:NAD+ synthase